VRLKAAPDRRIARFLRGCSARRNMARLVM
jgi:hypothetical protein